MAKEKVEALVEGGKASAGPPIGSSLGPLKVNIGQVVSEINKKTESFKGMKVPVKIVVDTDTKDFVITVGTPPVSQLIQKELNLQKGSGIPNKDKVGNIAIEEVIKIALMKQDSMFVNNLKSAVKTVAGSCNAMGLLIDGKTSSEINKDIDAGKYDKEINQSITTVPEEKKALLKEQLEVAKKEFQKELDRIKTEKAKVSEEPKEESPKAKEEKPIKETKAKEEKPIKEKG